MKSKSEGQLARARERRKRKYERSRFREGKEYISKDEMKELQQRIEQRFKDNHEKQ